MPPQPIKSRELECTDFRLGNLVNYEVTNKVTGGSLTGTSTISALDQGYLYIGSGIRCEYRMLQGIPLTPEWLERFKLDCEHGRWYFTGHGNKYSIRISKTGGRLYGLGNNAITVYFVHEFQNWYSLLTGQDLQTK